MPLFQESIVKKYLSTLNEEIIENAFLEFKKIYSPSKIKNIRTAKEEQYQEGFLKDVFGSVLGYSVYPEHPYNIETEKKNESNSKKADGAILKEDKVVGVIELKDNKTKNLDAVKDQAFGYKNNHKECSYVISSNFHKLRFYIDDATEYEEFDLYNLDRETFKRFYLYLRKEGLLDKNIPKLLRQETKFHEEEISKKLYKDYSSFKRSFFENALKNNPEHDKLLLFKKSQKFLDRVLFLLFAEDKGLVGTNSIVKIVEKWSQADDDYYRPLYELINVYFGHLYRGYKYQKTGEVIPQFGGELFAPDEILDNLKIDDEILKNDLLVLSKYDFNTDVDVNILGHIFEHSLNEVDDVEAELRGETLDKSKSKRKKDGVFYTPKYITKYIVDNTLGKLCAEKKAELKLDQDIAIFDYQKADGKLNEKGKELFERLNAYKDWLLTLKVCDPACGSGAFLNQALSFFIEEHRFVDDIIAELTNTPLRLFDTDLQILENNIYGVDINEESIEIAKLSLWLRTAQQGRKLSDLSHNIKCGNSLIDDPAVAGDKAFNWEKEFSEVFAKGGFDVVIGNPPYVQLQSMGSVSSDLEKMKFESYEKTGDLYCLFYELGNVILKDNGLLGFIPSNKWLRANYGKSLRNYLLENTQPIKLIDLGSGIFDSATVDSNILIFKKTTNGIKEFIGLDISNEKTFVDFTVYEERKVYLNILKNDIWTISSNTEQNLKDKIINVGIPLKNWGIEIKYGIKTGLNEAFIIDKYTRSQLILDDPKSEELIVPILRGRDVKRYQFDYQDLFLINTHNGYSHYPKIDINKFSAIKNHLDKFEPQLSKRYDKGSTSYNLRNCAYLDDFKKPKIIWKEMSSEPPFVIDNHGYFTNDTITFITGENLEFLLVILNSKLIFYLYSNYYSGGGLGNNGIRFKKEFISELPIIKVPRIQENLLIEKSNLMLQLNKDFQDQSQKLSTYISSQYNLEKLSTKLSNWYELSFSDFIQELNKAIKAAKGNPLTKKDEFEWMELFEENKKKALELKSQIDQTDKEIDRMVYELYGLTEEEIRIVEGS